MAPDALQPKAYCKTLVFSLSYLHRQVSPPETLVVKGGTTWARNVRWILPENARLPRNIQGSFTCRKSMTWDKRLYFPSEGRRAEDFFRPEKSDGFGRVWTRELGYQRPARRSCSLVSELHRFGKLPLPHIVKLETVSLKRCCSPVYTMSYHRRRYEMTCVFIPDNG